MSILNSLAITTVVLLLPITAAAQDEEQIEEVVVTGSHIEGLSETALAVTTLNEDVIRDLGAVSMYDLLAYIPSISDFEFEDNNNGTNGVRGDVAGINMRSLGTGNTLVLVDGRRMVIHPTFQPINSVPATLYNANSIPSSAIRRIEVLRDGASAIYGADASAGVVNFITRSGDEGYEFSGKYGAGDTNYDETEITGRAGFNFNGGNTSLGLFATYYTRSHVHMNELDDLYFDLDRRTHPAIPEEWQGDSQLRNTSTLTPYARVSVGSLNQDLQFIGSTFHVDSATGQLVSGSGSERYNFNETAWVTPEVDRFNFMASLTHEFASGLEFFGDISYYDSKSNTQRAASPIDDGLAFLIVPEAGFYNTTGEDVLVLGWRPVDLGPRVIEVNQDTYRFMAGLRGDWGRDWQWESGLVYSEAEAEDVEGNRQAKGLFIDQVSLTDASALNPFAGPGGNSAAALDAIRVEATDVRTSTITLWDFRLNNNELFPMWGGGAGFAAGVEVRKDEYEDDRDPRLDGSQPYDRPPLFDESDLIGVSATFDSKADRTTSSAYAEFFLPLVGEPNAVTGVRALEFQVAARYEHTDDFGSTTKPKILMRWEPFTDFSIRASYSEGFRAPNLPQMNQGTIVRRIDGIEDPLRSDVTDLPIDTGDTYRITTRIANLQLRPEDTETSMIGFAFAPGDGPLAGFLVTYDFWNIKQDGVVGILDPDDQLDLDVILREQGSFNPLVERAPITAQDQAFFDAWNAANPNDQRTAVGVATNIINVYENLDPREVEGWDAALEYATPETGIGSFVFRGDMTKITKFEQLGLAQTDLLRRNGNPELRYTISARWMWRGFGANVNVRYVDDVYDTSLWQSGSDVSGTYDPVLDRTFWNVADWTVWNLSLSYDFADTDNWARGLRINAGIRNLTDEKPPFADESFGYLTRLHNPYGRVVWGQLTYSF